MEVYRHRQNWSGKKCRFLLFLKLHQFKQKISRNIEFYCKPAWFQNQVHGTNSSKQKKVQMLSEWYHLNYLSFELLQWYHMQ